MDEELQGGFVNTVLRRGDVVLRKPASSFVHELLTLLDGWGGAPRFLGVEDGLERLSFVDGYVAWERPWMEAVTSADALRSVGRLVREFHDLTAGTSLAGDQEVVCHNDLSPKNTVYTTDGTAMIGTRGSRSANGVDVASARISTSARAPITQVSGRLSRYAALCCHVTELRGIASASRAGICTRSAGETAVSTVATAF